jgi:Calpain family cysteine protease
MFSKLFSRGSRNSSKTRKPRQPRRFQLETLEDRRLMTATSIATTKAQILLPPVTWADQNLKTAFLRSAVDIDAADGVLSRNDMIAIFRQVESAGNLATSVFTDLKSIVNHTAYFIGEGAVQQLSQDIVLGNVANAHYQGAALGNLAALSTPAKLEDLVDKWFLGEDHPATPLGTYTFASGMLYDANGGVQMGDVVQGHVADCYLMASLAEVAKVAPQDIKSMITINGDNTYTIRFFDNGKAEYVTVDNEFPVNSSGQFINANFGEYASSQSTVLWAALIEKAYAEMDETGWLSQLDKNSDGTSSRDNTNAYEHSYITFQGLKLVTEYTGGLDIGRAYVALQEITNEAGQYTGFSGLGMQGLMNLVNSGHMVTLLTIGDGQVHDPDIVNDTTHFYSVVSATPVTLFGVVIDVTFVVRNPWGPPGSKPEYVTLDWSQLTSNFQDVQYV